MLAHQHARGAGVVEMNVREEQVADVVQREPSLRQPLLERRNAGGRPAVEERWAVVGIQDVHADRAFVALVPQVDRLQLACDYAAAVERTSAASRSAIRSSADSRPTE